MLTLGHFLKTLSDYQPAGSERRLTAVVVDSRQAVPGSLFVALKGEKVDGHDFVADAFMRGATVAMIERPLADQYATLDLRTKKIEDTVPAAGAPLCLLVDNTVQAMQTAAGAWRDQFSVRVIGITGSVGKTSTKELAYSVLSQRYRTLKSPGNRNSDVGLPPVLFELRPHHERAVFEMGMYTQGEIAMLCKMARPVIGVVTMIGSAHMERAGSMEAIVAAKRELVEALPEDGVAILNKDDSRVMSMVGHTKARIFTYGLDSSADLWAGDIRSMGLDGVRFTLYYGREALSVQVPLIGRHNVHTALRATALGLVEGLRWDEIVAGLRETPEQLRLVSVPGPKESIIIDDTYNSSPDSALAALNLLHDLGGRRIAVMGDMLELGPVEETSHRLLGRRVVEVAHILVAVGRRARWMAEEAILVGMDSDQVFTVDDATAAVPVLQNLINEDDIVLIKGSLGMQMDRIVAALSRNS